MEAAQKHWFLLRKKLDFQARGHQNPPKIEPKPIKSRRRRARAAEKRFWRALETDFGAQDSDFGGHDGDFGGQNGAVANCTVMLGEIGGMAEAYSEARIERVQLEYGKISHAGHP